MQSFFNMLHCYPGVNIRRFSTIQKKNKQKQKEKQKRKRKTTYVL